MNEDRNRQLTDIYHVYTIFARSNEHEQRLELLATSWAHAHIIAKRLAPPPKWHIARELTTRRPITP